MRLRENTDARSVLSPSSEAEPSGRIRPCNKTNDPQLTVHTAPLTRELAARETDGICVQLLWNQDDGALAVSVEDERSGERFRFVVEPDRALDAFYHPFAYAA